MTAEAIWGLTSRWLWVLADLPAAPAVAASAPAPTAVQLSASQRTDSDGQVTITVRAVGTGTCRLAVRAFHQHANGRRVDGGRTLQQFGVEGVVGEGASGCRYGLPVSKLGFEL